MQISLQIHFPLLIAFTINTSLKTKFINNPQINNKTNCQPSHQTMSLKQGLLQLRQHARSKGLRVPLDEKTIIIPIYSFITQLITSMKEFLNNPSYNQWYIHLVDQHIRDRTFSNIVKTWERLAESSLQCHLLQTLLIVNNKNKLKLYLKARKIIVQTTSGLTMLDQILLNVQDAISIVHKLYHNQQIRKALIQGIKNIFMAFKMSEAKIYSSVFIQYLLTVYDSAHRIENQQATISAHFSNYKSYQNPSNYIELYSSISNFQSGIHDDNGQYKKTNLTQHHHKKYQIIDRKFMPLKETSQFVSNQNNNKSFTPSKHNQSHEKQKSLFYEFITENSHKQQNSIPEEQSIIQQMRSFSKSSEKKQTYLIDERIKEMKRHNEIQKPTNDKQNSISLYKRSVERQQATEPSKSNPKFSFKRNSITNQPSDLQLNKNFSLNWFSKKLFQTSDNEERQSVLRKSKNKLKKDAQQRKKIHVTSMDSTEKYQIENHLMKGNSIHLNQQKVHDQFKSMSNERDSNESEGQSVSRQEFEMMVSKNQQFKEKMLKKNYPSDGSNPSKNNSQNYQNNSKIIQQQSFDKGRKGAKSHHQAGHRVQVQHENIISPQRLQMMKQRNQQSLNFHNNSSQTQNYHRYPGGNIKKQIITVKINKRYQNEQQSYEKPQIIHKSIGQNRKNNLLRYNEIQYKQVSPTEMFYDQQTNSEIQKRSLENKKMKSILQIIDDYRQNTDPQYQSKQLQISESFCKKSNFDSKFNQEMDSAENYSFY